MAATPARQAAVAVGDTGVVAERPRLIFFYSPGSGPCRRAEAFLAHVLQRRKNHDTFAIIRMRVDRRPDLVERFRVDVVPTMLVVDSGRIRSRIVHPRGPGELRAALAPWLR